MNAARSAGPWSWGGWLTQSRTRTTASATTRDRSHRTPPIGGNRRGQFHLRHGPIRRLTPIVLISISSQERPLRRGSQRAGCRQLVKSGDQTISPGSGSETGARGSAHRLMVGVVAHPHHHHPPIGKPSPGGYHRHLPRLTRKTHSLQMLTHPRTQSIQHVFGARPRLTISPHWNHQNRRLTLGNPRSRPYSWQSCHTPNPSQTPGVASLHTRTSWVLGKTRTGGRPWDPRRLVTGHPRGNLHQGSHSEPGAAL